MKVSSLKNNLMHSQDSPWIAFFQDAFEKMPTLFEGLMRLNQLGLLQDRDKMGELIITLSKSDYNKLYKRLQELGFSPNLNQEAIPTDKEKYRVGSFLIRNLQTIEKEIGTLFESATLST